MPKLFDRNLLSEPDEIVGFFENILQASTQYAIIGVAPDGTIQLWNEGARLLYGHAGEDVIGLKKFSILNTPEEIQSGKPAEMMTVALEKGKWEGYLDRVNRDGGHFSASAALTVRRNASGVHVGFLLISSDVSGQLRQGDSLKMTELYKWSLIDFN